MPSLDLRLLPTQDVLGPCQPDGDPAQPPTPCAASFLPWSPARTGAALTRGQLRCLSEPDPWGRCRLVSQACPRRPRSFRGAAGPSQRGGASLSTAPCFQPCAADGGADRVADGPGVGRVCTIPRHRELPCVTTSVTGRVRPRPAGARHSPVCTHGLLPRTRGPGRMCQPGGADVLF